MIVVLYSKLNCKTLKEILMNLNKKIDKSLKNILILIFLAISSNSLGKTFNGTMKITRHSYNNQAILKLSKISFKKFHNIKFPKIITNIDRNNDIALFVEIKLNREYPFGPGCPALSRFVSGPGWSRCEPHEHNMLLPLNLFDNIDKSVPNPLLVLYKIDEFTCMHEPGKFLRSTIDKFDTWDLILEDNFFEKLDQHYNDFLESENNSNCASQCIIQ